jgi:rhodanese-related sulfurtransferase
LNFPDISDKVTAYDSYFTEGAWVLKEIHPEQFVAWYSSTDKKGIVVDVRELIERAHYHLPESIHLPMQSIPSRYSELPADQDIYVICAHGVRSAMVCEYLGQLGVDRLINVQGGMAAVSYIKDGFYYD